MWFKTRKHFVAEFYAERGTQTDEAFVAGCCQQRDYSAVALGVRRAIAILGEVEPEHIHHDDLFEGRLEKLPFWNSLDNVAIVLELEDELGVKISDAQAQQIRNPELDRGMTVADFVADVATALEGKIS